MRQKLITIVFCMILGSILVINLITPDVALSYSERRNLLQAPTVNRAFIFSGKAQTQLESYFLDQFVFRDTFRRAKAVTDLKLFQKQDNNGIYIAGDQVFKTDYPLKETSVVKLGEKMNAIYDKYLTHCKVAYAIIPDKNTYAPDFAKPLRYDYYDMAGILYNSLSTEGAVQRFEYIDLMDALTLSDYYRTDLHWRQEGLGNVLSKIGQVFGREFPAAGLRQKKSDWDEAGYQMHDFSPFYGAYYGQAALPLEPDHLVFFTSKRMDGFIVENMDSRVKPEDKTIYNTNKLGSIDSYEVFLSGNSPLITIENPGDTAGKELIVFRDSYGSSIAPLLAEGYSKVTLIDLRFVGYENIGEFVDFVDQDVLFLYSAGVANSSDMIREK